MKDKIRRSYKIQRSSRKRNRQEKEASFKKRDWIEMPRTEENTRFNKIYFLTTWKKISNSQAR